MNRWHRILGEYKIEGKIGPDETLITTADIHHRTNRFVLVRCPTCGHTAHRSATPSDEEILRKIRGRK